MIKYNLYNTSSSTWLTDCLTFFSVLHELKDVLLSHKLSHVRCNVSLQVVVNHYDGSVLSLLVHIQSNNCE